MRRAALRAWLVVDLCVVAWQWEARLSVLISLKCVVSGWLMQHSHGAGLSLYRLRLTLSYGFEGELGVPGSIRMSC